MKKIKKKITLSEHGSRHLKKLKKYSDNFNQVFKFFFEVNRRSLITFCGSNIEVEFDINSPNAKEIFKLFEDGKYNKTSIIKTKHPNLVKSVLIGKKGWGLWRKEWGEGIVKGLFKKDEILKEFEDRKIIIPKCFLIEFYNVIYKYDFNNF